VGQQDRAGQHAAPALARKTADLSARIAPCPGREIMFQKINLIRVGLSKMDIVLTLLMCVTISALYAAFLT
jgi:hypothetical protein